MTSRKLTVYSTRHREFTQLLADGFRQESGVEVTIRDIKSDAAPLMQEEGPDCPADIVLTVDFRRLLKLADANLAQPVRSGTLDRLVPAYLRDPEGRWFAQSMRARLIFVEKSLDVTRLDYDDLTDPRWRDRMFIRSADHMFNTGLIAAYLARYGQEKTKAWLAGIAANNPLGNGGDRNAARAIAEGRALIGVANSYYFGEMQAGAGGSEQKAWSESLRAIVPTFDDGRTPINITGAAVATHAPHREEAVAFLEYLAGDNGQQIYADVGYEYPVSERVAPNPIIRKAGELRPDTRPFPAIAAFSETAEAYARNRPWNQIRMKDPLL
ncbi:iron(III) transport system substrate-binding protein [Rhodovulum sulfidophilum]|uniref:extracellular solute-binding protein n=1 Tax=Rhodovulum sulfidophilum TaxID=35806 RepID=UPI00069810AA|nr:extracellular solute-binding protein [Rhodovulum sulfidophilum]ANB33295.1 hypothetical protein A6W98_03940 [Rhodovulum sulfidophilum DSM 1374]ANB37143.1 hypothetical protein A6024_03925 [Rhodovulum sulfidophilum]MCW2305244.1 iron(III) transport system substrate-binding protein [Rhodovulum sulfidophilum]